MTDTVTMIHITTTEIPLPPPEQTSYENEVCLPTYSIYLIAFAYVLLFLIIIYLIYTLHKMRGTEYKIFSKNDTTSVSFNRPSLSRQDTNEGRSPIPITITDCDSAVHEDFEFEYHGSMRDVADNETTISKRQNTLRPIAKKHLQHPQSIISPEQMKSIIDGVLRKQLEGNTCAKDLNALLSNLESFSRRSSVRKSEMAREKSASTPQLDIYDQLPHKNTTSDKVDGISKEETPKELSKSETVKFETKIDILRRKSSVKANQRTESIETDKNAFSKLTQKIFPKVTNSDKDIMNGDDQNCDDDIPLYDSPSAVKNDGNKEVVTSTESTKSNKLKTESTREGKIISDDEDDIYSSPGNPYPLKGVIVTEHGYVYPLSGSMSDLNQTTYANANNNFL